jgi:hypothetical protein
MFLQALEPPTMARGATPFELADACREAVIEFLNGVLVEGWGPSHLAAWLRGPYRTITRRGAALVASLERGPQVSAALVRWIENEDRDRVLREAANETLETLRSASDPSEGASFACAVIAEGLVIPCSTSWGTETWLPVATPRMRLVERVRSLIAADYLLRPEDYEVCLAICGRCEAVSFDPVAKSRGVCRSHATSVVVRRWESGTDGLGPHMLVHLASAGQAGDTA